MVVDSTCCPLCGQKNDCVTAAGDEKNPCWCRESNFPQELLSRIPLEARKKACICQRCVDALNKK